MNKRRDNLRMIKGFNIQSDKRNNLIISVINFLKFFNKKIFLIINEDNLIT